MAREKEEFTSLSEQAAHWWVLFQDGDASALEKREFSQWLARAPQNVEAILRAEGARRAVSRKNVRWPRTAVADLVREAKAAPGEKVIPLQVQAITRPLARRRPIVASAVGLAAVVLAAVGGSWFLLSRPEQFQTRVGEQRSLMLADGSRVTLNTASMIEVRLQKKRRSIELVKGEALFEIAHDAARPFDVEIGNVLVRDVGTQFDVDRRALRTTVTVVEGRVVVLAGTAASKLLSAGDRVVINAAGMGPVQPGAQVGQVTAWIQRKLVFERRPLGEIADEFNRYNVGQIEVRSASLRAREVTGTFRSDDAESFVALLSGSPGVHVARSVTGGYTVTFDEPAASQR